MIGVVVGWGGGCGGLVGMIVGIGYSWYYNRLVLFLGVYIFIWGIDIML